MLEGLVLVAVVLLLLGVWALWAIAAELEKLRAELEKLRQHNEAVCPWPEVETPVAAMLAEERVHEDDGA